MNPATSMSRILYFAYGANLEPRRFRRRCPGVTAIGRARLPGHRLAFTRYSRPERGGVADIVADADAEVWGVLWEMDERCVAALDDFEGVPQAYRRESVRVIDDGGAEHEAMAYVANRTGSFPPSSQYLSVIVAGARAHGLPEAYVAALEEQGTGKGELGEAGGRGNRVQGTRPHR
jgi:gamma-glutamylcyclotransferase (GGCT)/AIG2-like uncharacterized protein YtfP